MTQQAALLPPIDYAASPTLTTIREVAGEEAVMRLVLLCGGRAVHLPVRLTANSQLVRVVGEEAAHAIVRRFGARDVLRIPTGKGHAHGRRIDPREVMRMRDEDGASLPKIAEMFGCTERNISRIVANNRPLPPRARKP